MLTLNNIIEATRGELIKQGLVNRFKSISINTETLRPGAVFVAIKGKRLDGHRFISKAIKQGAVAVVVSRPVKVKNGITVVCVKDTTEALGNIAAHYRSQFKIPLIAITGSAGKTSTKEWIASVLQSRYRVLKNPKSLNNQFGVPLTLFKLKKSHQVAVLELGTNCPGDIESLAKMVKPTIVVLTNIGESHLEQLKSRYGVFLEKKKILRYLKESGTIILNTDDPYLKKIKAKSSNQHIMGYAIDQSSTFQANDVVFNSKGESSFQVDGKTFHLKALGRHNIYNALAAICCGRLFNISYNIIIHRLSKAKNIDGRQKIYSSSNLLLMDDSYNSNPVSFRSAIETLDTIKGKKGAKKFLICADMLELGPKAKELHLEIADVIMNSTIDYVLTKGALSQNIAQKIQKQCPSIQAVHCETFRALKGQLKKRLVKKAIVLVKGSRSMKMETIVKFIQEHY